MPNIISSWRLKDHFDVPIRRPEWIGGDPAAMAAEFAEKHPEFLMEQPTWPFNESELSENFMHWSGAWLNRK